MLVNNVDTRRAIALLMLVNDQEVIRVYRGICALLVLLSMVLVTPSASAQMQVDWVRLYSGASSGSDTPMAIDIGSTGNVVVAGDSWGGSDKDLLLVCYSPQGDSLWSHRLQGAAGLDDHIADMDVDSLGSIYITGYQTGADNLRDYFTSKLSPSGSELWTKTYQAGDGPPNGHSEAQSLKIDNAAAVFVTGFSRDVTRYAYATIKYSSDGDSLWIRRFTGTSAGQSYGYALGVDGSGDSYVTGGSFHASSGQDFTTVKYDGEGNTLWSDLYDGPGAGGDDYAYLVTVDAAGFVYVAGESMGESSGFDFAVVKYQPDGDTVWVRRYNGPGNGDDVPADLAVDSEGSVYITGVSPGSGTADDYATIRYLPDGEFAWIRRYDGPGDSTDDPSALKLDGAGNICVTGFSYSGQDDSTSDMMTICYAPDGQVVWQDRYDGLANARDVGTALAIDGQVVYVTGETMGPDGSSDFVTIRYAPVHSGVRELNSPSVPTGFHISQNYPNPFNAATVIDFEIPKESEIDIEVFDIGGRVVRRLFNGALPEGQYEAEWNGRDVRGVRAASGIYICRFQTREFTQSLKLVLLK